MGKIIKKSFCLLLSCFLFVTTFGLPTLTVLAESDTSEVSEVVPEGTFKEQNTTSLSNYVSKSANGSINSDQGKVTLSKLGGDHHAIADLDVMYKSFVYEADVVLKDYETGGAVGLSLYRNKDNVTQDGWFGANYILDEGRMRFFRVNAAAGLVDNGADIKGLDGSNHLRLEVNEKGEYQYTISNAIQEQTISGTIDGWYGAYLGLLTFNAEAEFSNVKVTNLSGETPLYFNAEQTNVSNTNGDHGVYLEALKGRLLKNFSFETDARVTGNVGEGSGALLLGYDESNPTSLWTGINFHKNANVTKIFGSQTEAHDHSADDFDMDNNIHLYVSVNDAGDVVYRAIDSDGTVNQGTSKISNWNGAYLGLLTFSSEVNFYNTRVVNFDGGLDNTGSLFVSDLSGLQAKSGNWSTDYNGLKGSIDSDGDAILLSDTTAGDCVYETDVKFNEKRGAASLIIHSDSDDMSNRHMYVANLNGQTGEARLFKFEQSRGANGVYNNATLDLANSKVISLNDKNEYHLKVVSIGKHFVYYINGELVINTADYTADSVSAETVKAHHGQNDAILEGKMGLMTWNGNVSYQNVKVTTIDDSNTPQLDNLTIANASKDIDKQIAFMKGQYVYLGYVKNNVGSVSLNAVSHNGSKVTVTNAIGEECDINNLPVSLGENIYTLEVRNGNAKVVYKVQLHRCQPDATYYNEDYRGQYHYSVKDGWGNDPNGMVYYKGVYHLFYQFYDAPTWGPMHWGHATSKDLIHWEEQPIALYPDEYGTMYSGCAVIADHDTAPGVFAQGEEGIVLLITTNGTNGGDGQRIIMAYSKDGKTWQKKEDAKVILDWTEDDSDTLTEHKSAFRDPKVFRYDNKWFMVVAGGPLRIYSSDNLIDWSLESAYRDLHTECPDLYPIQYSESDGTITTKWVLDRGGRYYKVGDFRKVDGKYRYIPDNNYVAAWYKDEDPNDLNRVTNYKGDSSWENGTLVDGIMNFGSDYYAAMTYYVQDFGTKDNVTVPRLIAINWMNTWDDYCTVVANKTGNEVFNGTYNLQVELGLVKDENGNYLLKQTPIKEYESLRQAANFDGTVEVTPDNTLFDDFNQSSYEIVANFKPKAGTSEVGFNVRVGDGQKTVVKYNFDTETISIDRSQSGILLSSKFAQVHSQNNVTKNADGSIDLHLYVDRSSVEVYSANDTVSGADQIFPNATSNGLQVFSVGGNATADIAIYPLATIWDKETPSEPTAINANKKNLDMYVGDQETVSVWASPVDFVGDVDLQATCDNDDVVGVAMEKDKVMITAKAKGKATITVTSKKYPNLSTTIDVNVRNNNFNTNIKDFVNVNGNWYIDDEELIVSNTGANDIYMGNEAMHQPGYIVEADMKFTKGLINLFIASSSTNPFADGGAYSVQLDGDVVRLFRFGVDGDIASTATGIAMNDGNYHHVKVIKSANKIAVLIDGTEVCSKELDASTLASYFTKNAYVGLGLWDGDLSVKNFIVTQDADYSKVDAAIASQPNNLSDYVQDSVDALKDAIAAVVKDKDITEQDVVDAYAQAILDAIKALQYKPADYTKVDEAKAKVPSDLSSYTEESVKALEDALNAVEADKNITEQTTVDAYAEAIEKALNSLTYKPADYTKVDEAKAKVPSDLSSYTEESVKALEDALNAVEANKNITEQATVDAYADAINKAIEGLVKKIISYKVIEGEGETFVKESEKDISIRIDHEYTENVKVEVDDQKVDKVHYKVTKGSTIITFDDMYLNTLAVGTHHVKVTFEDGIATTTLVIKEQTKDDKKENETPVKDDNKKNDSTSNNQETVKSTVKAENKQDVKKVKTGDDENIIGIALLLLGSLVVLTYIRKKKIE